MYNGNNLIEVEKGKRKLWGDKVCLAEFLEKLNLVKELVFLEVKAVPGKTETLLIEYGTTGVILNGVLGVNSAVKTSTSSLAHLQRTSKRRLRGGKSSWSKQKCITSKNNDIQL